MKYEINDETIALIPIDCSNSRVIEVKGDYIIPQNIYEIMEKNCEYYGSTYDGRIKAAQKLLNFSYKLPLLVEESEKIIFFPTKTATSDDCCWINHNFVKERIKNGKKTRVIFKNGLEEEFNISKLSFENQLLRAGLLDSIIDKRKKHK